MTTSILLFNEHLADASRWATRTVTVSGGGATTAALPATNIFTANPAQVWQRTTIADSDTVVLDVNLIDATAPTPLLGNVGACWGLLNCHAVRESTGELLDLRVRVRESNTSFTSGYVLDKTHDVYLREFQSAAARQTWFLREGSAPLDSASSVIFANRGGNLTTSFVRIEFSMPTLLGTWTLRLGRLVRMSGLVCEINSTPLLAGFDQSEIVRAYSGRPFALAGAQTRRYRGQIVSLTDRQVQGVFLAEPGGGTANFFRPAINTIARVAGRAGEVCVIERYTMPDGSSRWQQQPIFGLFEDDLAASRVATTPSGDGLHTASFSIVESPQFNV
jgi:hypothetical protein